MLPIGQFFPLPLIFQSLNFIYISCILSITFMQLTNQRYITPKLPKSNGNLIRKTEFTFILYFLLYHFSRVEKVANFNFPKRLSRASKKISLSTHPSRQSKILITPDFASKSSRHYYQTPC